MYTRIGFLAVFVFALLIAAKVAIAEAILLQCKNLDDYTYYEVDIDKGYIKEVGFDAKKLTKINDAFVEAKFGPSKVHQGGRYILDRRELTLTLTIWNVSSRTMECEIAPDRKL